MRRSCICAFPNGQGCRSCRGFDERVPRPRQNAPRHAPIPARVCRILQSPGRKGRRPRPRWELWFHQCRAAATVLSTVLRPGVPQVDRLPKCVLPGWRVYSPMQSGYVPGSVRSGSAPGVRSSYEACSAGMYSEPVLLPDRGPARPAILPESTAWNWLRLAPS